MHKISCILLWIGGLNWGLVGLGNFMDSNWNVVAMILPMMLANIIYVLVGVAAIYELATHKGMCKGCDSKSGGAM